MTGGPGPKAAADWPSTGGVAENEKALYQAKLDAHKADLAAALALAKAADDARLALEKARFDFNVEREKMVQTNEYTQAQQVHAAYLEVAKGALERGAAKATFVQGAATAISGVYAAVLGVTFAVAQDKILPPRGLAPAVFLGLAIALATAYTSFLTKPRARLGKPDSGLLPLDQIRRRNAFVEWTRDATLTRRWALQASVISLGVGTVLLPLPFLTFPDEQAFWISATGLLAVIVIPLVIAEWEAGGVPPQ
jgi:hypothetical protein